MPSAVQVEMNEGLNAIEEQNYFRAIGHFDSVLSLNKNFAPAFYFRGISYKIINELGHAEFNLKVAASYFRDKPEVYVELGDIKFLEKNFANAEEYYQKALEINKNFVVAHFKMGTLSSSQGKYESAIKYFEKCNKIDVKFPNAYLATAILKIRLRSKDSNSIEDFSKAIQADSTFALAYFWRGLNYLRLRDTSRCLIDWTKAIELQPINPMFTVSRGSIFVDQNKFDDAYRDFRKTIVSHPIDEKRSRFNNTVIDKQIDVQNAVNYLSRFGRSLDENALNNIQKAFCLMFVSRFQDALTALNYAMNIQPSAPVYYFKGLLFESYPIFQDSAINNFEKALAFDKNMFDVNKKLAIYKYKHLDWKGAYGHLREMNRIQPGSEVTWRLSGLIKNGLKDYYGAIIDFTRCIKMDSFDIEILNARAIAWMEVEDSQGFQRRFLFVFKSEFKPAISTKCHRV